MSRFQSGRVYGILHFMQPAAEPTTSALNQLLEPLSRSLGSEAAQQILAFALIPQSRPALMTWPTGGMKDRRLLLSGPNTKATSKA